MVTNVFFLSNKMRAEVLSIGLKPIDEINRPSMRCFLKKRHPRWALNLPLHTFLKHQTIKRFVGNKKHSYSLSFNVPRRLRPISTTSRSSHWGPHACQMPTRSDSLVLFLERFSRFSLTAFYTTFIYGAQANIDGCNTNLDSIFSWRWKPFDLQSGQTLPTPPLLGVFSWHTIYWCLCSRLRLHSYRTSSFICSQISLKNTHINLCPRLIVFLSAQASFWWFGSLPNYLEPNPSWCPIPFMHLLLLPWLS